MEINKMKYRDMLGFPKKKAKKKVEKKVAPKPTAPPITELLKEEFGDTINEGPAYEYAKYTKNIEKAEKQLEKAVEQFELFLYRKKGLKKESSIINSTYVGYVGKFMKALEKVVRGLL